MMVDRSVQSEIPTTVLKKMVEDLNNGDLAVRDFFKSIMKSEELALAVLDDPKAAGIMDPKTGIIAACVAVSASEKAAEKLPYKPEIAKLANRSGWLVIEEAIVIRPKLAFTVLNKTPELGEIKDKNGLSVKELAEATIEALSKANEVTQEALSTLRHDPTNYPIPWIV